MTRKRARRSGAAVAIAASMLAGCASIPSSADVAQVAGERGDDQPVTTYQPPGPTPGARPRDIVVGFLDAMRAFPISTDVARRYLTPDAAARWRPEHQTVIYDDASTVQTARTAVDFRARRVASLDSRGAYTPATDRLVSVARHLRLRRVGGQWRIGNPPNALLVSTDFFADYYQAASLYFFDARGRVLVPDPVYLPRGDQLATSLVRGVLAGPSADLRGQVQLVLPPTTEVDVSVPVRSDGVAEVRLPASVVALTPSQRQHLAAQLVWTLRQVGTVAGIRILAGGVPLDVPGAAEVEDLTLWDGFGPPQPSPAGQLFALQRGRLVAVQETTVSPFQGLWGNRRRPLADFDVTLSSDPRLVGVTGDRTRLVLAPLGGNVPARPNTILRGGSDLTDPSWDSLGRVWVVQHVVGGSLMSVIDPSAPGESRVARVDIGRLAATRIEAFALSPDGSRFAAIAQAVTGARLGPRRLWLGTLPASRGRMRTSVSEPAVLLTSGTTVDAPTDLEWSDATTLSVLARVGAGPTQPYQVRIDGSRVEGVAQEPPLVRATTIAAGGSLTSPTYVGNDRGVLLVQEPEGNWVRVSRKPLEAPDYPGSATTVPSTANQPGGP